MTCRGVLAGEALVHVAQRFVAIEHAPIRGDTRANRSGGVCASSQCVFVIHDRIGRLSVRRPSASWHGHHHSAALRLTAGGSLTPL